jgi:hypothetical protein
MRKSGDMIRDQVRFSCTHFFSGDRAKNDQLRVFGMFREQFKRAAIQWDPCI